jgi:uncharacterized protein RhaS with RHS repeats
MKKGDLVRCLRSHHRVGKVVRTYHNHNGLVLVVQWPNGHTHEYTYDDLQTMEIK